jgi:succinate dehydrogenase / fumarate reductase membrane anchor subunit
MSLVSPLGRVLGLGAAGEGVAHWWAQRLSSVALAVLGGWFLIALIRLPDFAFDTAAQWLRQPLHAVLLLLFVAASCYHSYLGLQVVVEDYVHAVALKVATLIALSLAHLFVAALALYAVLKVALGAAP